MAVEVCTAVSLISQLKAWGKDGLLSHCIIGRVWLWPFTVLQGQGEHLGAVV